MSGLSEALDVALQGLELKPFDGATVQLARVYALQIDDGGDATKLGPALLACLKALLMTPEARAAVRKGVVDHDRPEPRSPLDELRAKRAARANRAASLDSPAS